MGGDYPARKLRNARQGGRRPGYEAVWPGTTVYSFRLGKKFILTGRGFDYLYAGKESAGGIDQGADTPDDSNTIAPQFLSTRLKPASMARDGHRRRNEMRRNK